MNNSTEDKSDPGEQRGVNRFKQVIRDSKYSEQIKHNLLLPTNELQDKKAINTT